MDQDSAAREARDAAQAMIGHLRAQEVEPYRDRRPVPRVIDVVGRRSGVPRPFGVNVTSVDGHLYVCSSTRERDWVANLLAAGRCRVERDGPGGGDTERAAVMVEGHEAARVLAIYLAKSGHHDPGLPFEPDAPVEEIARHVHRTAVLRLDPQGGPTSPAS